MKYLVLITLFFLNATVLASDSITVSNVKLSDILTCKVSWDDLKNNPSTGENIKQYIESNYHKFNNVEGLVPNQDMKVFGSKILRFMTSFGMSPGFSVSLNSDIKAVRHYIESEYKITFDSCNNNQCLKSFSKTETFALLNESGSTFAGCIYPYMK